jgi:predicted nucleic acid-binding protein
VIAELFCDTSYFVALLDPHDDLHEQAAALEHQHRNTPLCTTSSVLVETLNYFSRYNPDVRIAAAELIAAIEQHEQFAIVHLSRDLLRASIDFYRERNDKSYSGTDCISMLVMRERDIEAIFTSDVHFYQEGFQLLMTK